MDDETKAIKDMFEHLEARQQFKGFSFYKLDENHNVIQCSAFESMTFGMEEKNNIVAQTELPNGARISTVFLGGFMVSRELMERLFETMVFGGPNNGYVRQYASWDEAVRGHQAAVLLSEG